MRLEFVLLLILGFQVVFAVLNSLFFTRLRQKNNIKSQSNARISVLVPARNEARNLERLLSSLQTQDDPHFEVIVLNDHSSDDTLQVVRRFAAIDSRVLALAGEDLPTGWLGKNFACHQLSCAATGEILIFTDADTQWSSDGVRLVREAFERSQADALSAFPEQACQDPLSSLIQPLQQWSLITFLPMWFVPVRAFPLAVAANGQLLCFRKSIYQQIGGHDRVRGSVIEDMGLARLVKQNGGKFVLLNAVGVVRTFMYSSFQETWAGYAKNAYPAFGANLLALFLVLALNLVLYVLPWWLFAFKPSLETGLLVLLGLCPRLLADVVSGYGWRLFVFHPVSLLAWTAISVQSVFWYVSGRVQWKGRAYDLRQVSQASSIPVLETSEHPRQKHPS